MTVENKFKRNVLAASVLVGLSLSAASGGAWAEAESASETLQLKGGSEALSADTTAGAEDTGKNSEVQSADSLATIKEDAPGVLSSGDKLSEGSPGSSQEDTNLQTENPGITNGEKDEIKSDEKKEDGTSEHALPEDETERTEQQEAPAAQHGDSESLNEGKSGEDKSLIEKVGDSLKDLVNAVDFITGGGASTSEENKEGDSHTPPDGAEDNSQSLPSVSPSTEGGDSNPSPDGKPVV
ncbi:hypothetical protein J9N36_004588, partial [Salmonella enterica]|nr:hypothetical protein [Salmonella enterica]